MRLTEIKSIAASVLGEAFSLYGSREESKNARAKLKKFADDLKRKLKGKWRFEYMFAKYAGFHQQNIYYKKSPEHGEDHIGTLLVEPNRGLTITLAITEDPGYRNPESHEQVTVDKAARILAKHAKKSNP